MFTFLNSNIIRSRINGEETRSCLFESPNSTYFFTNNLKDVFSGVIQLFLDNCTENEINRLLSKQCTLRIKLFSRDEKSYVETTVVSISGYNEPKLRNIFSSLTEHFISCEIILEIYEHYLVIFDQCIIQKSIDIPFIYNDVLYEKGINMIGRTSYRDETDEEIIRKQEEYNIFIWNRIHIKERYDKFQMMWNKAALKEKKNGIKIKYSKIFVASYNIYAKGDRELHSCTLSIGKHTYLPKTEYLCLVDTKNNEIHSYPPILLDTYVKYFNLKEVRNPKDIKVIYYECNTFPNEEQMSELMLGAIEL